jgi:hypothetical protein
MHLATCFVQRQFGPISSNKTYVYGRALARVLIMAPSLPTSLRSLLWHARVQERESSELDLQHVPHRKAFDLAGRQVRPIRPKSTRFSPPAIRASAAFSARREAELQVVGPVEPSYVRSSHFESP